MRFALEYPNGHELHSSCPVSCSTRLIVQIVRQVKINQHSSRISFTPGVRDDNIILRNVPMKYPSLIQERSMRLDKITTRFQKLFDRGELTNPPSGRRND